LELREYNGWENKLTWLVHLHLSSEEHLKHAMTSLVADTPIGYPVGKLVEQLVREALTNWHMGSGSQENGRPFKVVAMEKKVRALHHV
jgi:hypothetical protein